eukprot:jgi/Botrbrau1/11214/Bobra.0075s0010.1
MLSVQTLGMDSRTIGSLCLQTRLNPSSFTQAKRGAQQHLCRLHSRFNHVYSLVDLKEHLLCSSLAVVRTCQSRSRRIRHAAAATVNSATSKIGFIGMGLMGVPMAINLVKAGYNVTVWNRSPAKAAPVQQAGGKVAKDLESLAKESDIIFAMLADPPAALQVAQQVAPHLRSGSCYVDVSTVDAGTVQQIEKLVKEAGGRYLEAPVSGSTGPAQQGALIFMTAGDETAFAEAGPLLDVMGKAKYFLGAAGQGANMKLVVNMLMGDMMCAFSESFALAEAAGLSKDDLLDIVNKGAVAAPMYGLKGPKMLRGEFDVAFPLKHQRKDLRLALALASSLGTPLPLSTAADDYFLQAEKDGLGDLDFSAVLKAVEPQ